MKQTPAPAITVSQLNIRYEQRLLFNRFEIYLSAGKCTCLLGSSGIGKTSLLRFIAGLQYDKNTECLGHITTSDKQSVNGRLTYMTQLDSLLPWLNIIDNVLFGYRLRREKITPALQQKAIALLEKVGLSKIEHMRPSQLSQGMRQRVTLVRSLVEDRPIILMDEPFSALDVITKLKLQNLAASLLVNRTVLLVTHDPLEALRLGHRIYVMSGSPTKISDMLEPQGVIPRDSNNINLLEQQAQLLQMLTKNDLE